MGLLVNLNLMKCINEINNYENIDLIKCIHQYKNTNLINRCDKFLAKKINIADIFQNRMKERIKLSLKVSQFRESSIDGLTELC